MSTRGLISFQRLCSPLQHVPSPRSRIGFSLGRNVHPRTFSTPAMVVAKPEVVMGCVAYCQEIGGIWDGMKSYFSTAGLQFDYVLFTSYEAQVEALLKGQIDIAWNGPLAHVRLQNRTNNGSVSLGMRDVDRNCISHIVVREDSGIKSIGDIVNRRLATGTADSPQAYILPLHHLKKQGVALNSLSVTRFDRDIGKHGDTAVGETEVLRALEGGEVDVGFVSELMWSRAINAGDINANKDGRLVILPNGPSPFDHCQFDALPTFSKAKQAAFTKALFGMDWNDHNHRRVMQMEGLRKQWERPREEGYDTMREALAEEPNVEYPPLMHVPGCHPFKSLTVA